MGKCPTCHLELAVEKEAPNGVAWHVCLTSADQVKQAILSRILDPEVKADVLIVEAIRATVAIGTLTGELNPQSVGQLLKGHAEVMRAGGGGVYEDLLGFFEDDEEAEEAV